MFTSQTLPENYRLLRTIDLRKETRLMLGLNVLGLGLFVVFGALFFAILARSRTMTDLEISGAGWVWMIVGVLACYGVALTLHELIHGMFFWLFAGVMPTFGVRSLYVYAAAPGWYFPRSRYLIIGLAPFVLITLAGVALLPLVPAWAFGAWWFILTVNASGAVGDLYFVAWLLFQNPLAVIDDQGDQVFIYEPD